ncbi:hypothetical protein RCL1_007929 [Eukaryota sp. TZLM3-RCL]
MSRIALNSGSPILSAFARQQQRVQILSPDSNLPASPASNISSLPDNSANHEEEVLASPVLSPNRKRRAQHVVTKSERLEVINFMVKRHEENLQQGNEFERLSKAGVKFNTGLLRTLAISALEIPSAQFQSNYVDPNDKKRVAIRKKYPRVGSNNSWR